MRPYKHFKTQDMRYIHKLRLRGYSYREIASEMKRATGSIYNRYQAWLDAHDFPDRFGSENANRRSGNI